MEQLDLEAGPEGRWIARLGGQKVTLESPSRARALAMAMELVRNFGGPPPEATQEPARHSNQVPNQGTNQVANRRSNQRSNQFQKRSGQPSAPADSH